MLDTSVLVAGERHRTGFQQVLRALGDAAVGIAAITAAELLHGCHRARDPAVRARRLAFVEGLLAAVPVLGFSLVEARFHAEVWARLAEQGRVIGPYDLLVAATALARGDALATLNQREFARVPGLILIPVDGLS